MTPPGCTQTTWFLSSRIGTASASRNDTRGFFSLVSLAGWWVPYLKVRHPPSSQRDQREESAGVVARGGSCADTTGQEPSRLGTARRRHQRRVRLSERKGVRR